MDGNAHAADPQSSAESTTQLQHQQDGWLTSLQLVAIQPSCLKAHPDTPLPHQDQQPVQAAHEQADAPVLQQQQQPGQQFQQHPQQQLAADLQHYELLLQLQATLTSQDQPAQRQLSPHSPHLQVSTVSAGATVSNSPLLPLSVQTAVLQVVLLNRQMQVLLHKQYSFQQLLQEQQHQHGSVQHDRDSAAGSSSQTALSPFTTAAAAAGSSSQGVSSCMSSAQDTERLLHLNIRLSAPSQPSPYILDALHLFVTLCSAQLSDPAVESDGQQQQACLVAELPLLVMPAPAQQEVQQLLLPAMRQDVQSEQLQQQEEQGLQLGPAAIAAQSLQVEQAVWQHFNQLALDILLIMQLSEAVRAEAAQGAGAALSVAVESSQPLSASAAGSLPAAVEDALQHHVNQQQQQLLQQQQQQHHQQQQQEADAEGAQWVPGTTSAMENLLQAVNTLLLPLLLPFLTAHGLHSTLQVLLQCLPPQLQLQQHWQQQQLARLQALTVQAQQPQEDQPGLFPAAGAALPALSDVVVVSSAMLDTPASPQRGAGATSAPAAAEDAMSTKSSSVYESFASSKSSSPDSSPEQQQQYQEQPLLADLSLQELIARRSSGAAGAPQQQSSSSGMETQQGGQGLTSSSTFIVEESTIWHGGASQAGSSRHMQQGAAGAASSTAGGAESGLRRRGSVAHLAGRSPSGDDPGERQDGSSRSSRGDAGHQGLSGLQFGVLTEATGMPCWVVPFRQFEDSEMERRYVAYKHHQLLFLDVLGGVFQLSMAAALTKRVLFEHPATWVLILMTLMKALPHVPLLLGYTEQHIRFRELWMFLASPCIGLLLCFLVLFTNAWQPSVMPPMPLAYRSFWRMHGELITAALRAFFQHMRLRPFILYTVVDRLISMQLWAPWSGALTAVGRSSLAGLVSVLVCWALELCYRRRFVLAGLYAPAAGAGGARVGRSAVSSSGRLPGPSS